MLLKPRQCSGPKFLAHYYTEERELWSKQGGFLVPGQMSVGHASPHVPSLPFPPDTADILNQGGIQCPQLVKSINLTTHETQIEGTIIYIIQLFYNHHMTRMADQTIIFEILESPSFLKI